MWWCAVAAAAEFVEEEEASADVDVGRDAGHTAPCTPQTVKLAMMMLEVRISTCGKVAESARRLIVTMVQRSRTIRRTVLNWGAVGEVIESGLLAAGCWDGGVTLALGMSSSLSSSIRSSCAVHTLLMR